VLTALLAISADLVRAQQAPATIPAPGEATYVVFVNGRAIGREQANLARTPAGWTITSTGTLGAPLNLVNKRFELTYATDWQPIELKIDATIADPRDAKAEPRVIGLATSFATTTAINEVTQNGVTGSKTDQITARTVVMPGNFFAAYEALAVRLSSMTPGGELAIYVAPQGESKAVIKAVTPATYETPAGTLKARRFSLTFQHPTGPLDVEVTVDERGRFAKADMPGLGVSIARQDLASVETRQQTLRNPTDSEVVVPAAGFGLAGTLTTPPRQGRLRHPAIVLVAGSGPVDRDVTVAGSGAVVGVSINGAAAISHQLSAFIVDRNYEASDKDSRAAIKTGAKLDGSQGFNAAGRQIGPVFAEGRQDGGRDGLFPQGQRAFRLQDARCRIPGLQLAGQGGQVVPFLFTEFGHPFDLDVPNSLVGDGGATSHAQAELTSPGRERGNVVVRSRSTLPGPCRFASSAGSTTFWRTGG
jgi:hypothetical protein